MERLFDKYLPQELRIFLKWVIIFIFIVFVVPMMSFLVWQILPKSQMNLIVVNKTVTNSYFQEHQSIHWTLNHLKYVKSNGDPFNYKEDFFGYFPDKDGNYQINDLNGMSSDNMDLLVDESSLIYFADTYGVYQIEVDNTNATGLEKIYGGMEQDDVDFLQKAYKAEKTIIAEFNSIASPTKKGIRNEFENLVDLRWTGWIARHFDELDTLLNDELPDWMIQAYIIQHANQWDLEGSGMVFLHENGQIEILVNGKHTQTNVPNIKSSILSQNKYGIPEKVKYPYWFDILLVGRDYEVISYYDIEPTLEGIEMLRNMRLPRYFPAAVVKQNGSGKFYYFAGDFADNPISKSSHKFFGIAGLWKMFLHADDYSQRRSFFWNYYFPLMKTIFEGIETEK